MDTRDDIEDRSNFDIISGIVNDNYQRFTAGTHKDSEDKIETGIGESSRGGAGTSRI